MALAILVAAGCQNNKKSTDSSAMDLTNAPAPAAYNPQPAAPIQTAAPMPVAPDTSGSTINAAVAPSGSTYTVKHGDTLWKIAQTHYGDGRKWKQIQDANPGLEPSKLKVGQTITLP